MNEAKKTTDPKEIQQWAEKHGGIPAIIKGRGNGGKGEGVLRIHFPKKSDSYEDLEEISWEEFARDFEHNQLALLYDPAGDFNKFVCRE